MYSSEEIEGLVLRGWLSSSGPYVLGEPIFLTVEWKNVSQERKGVPVARGRNPLRNPVTKVIARKTLHRPEREIGYTFYGRQNREPPIRLSGQIRVLAPGQSIKDYIWLSHEYDLSMTGEYEIEISRRGLAISGIELRIEYPNEATLRQYEGRMREIRLSDEEKRLLKAFKDKRQERGVIPDAEALEVAELIISKRFTDIHVIEHLGKFGSYVGGSFLDRDDIGSKRIEYGYNAPERSQLVLEVDPDGDIVAAKVGEKLIRVEKDE